jgi:hypothetical protein
MTTCVNVKTLFLATDATGNKLEVCSGQAYSALLNIFDKAGASQKGAPWALGLTSKYCIRLRKLATTQC